MRYLSVCSGIEAATVAWHPLGWEAAAFSEIEPFPRAVLAHHYPTVPCHGDFTTIGADDYGAIDLLVGGTPCQSFSIAGLRGGMADERGNLALEYLRLADRKRPRWLVWENVPGVLSSNGGRDFGTFLGALGELGYGFAYRVLDAQFFGVAQRRRRVFVVGYLGDWRRAAAVLFERHSLSGHPAPRRQAGPSVAALTANGVGTCGADDNQGQAGHLVPWPAEVAPTLNAHFGDKMGLENQHALNGAGLFVAHSLRGEGFDASEDGTGRGTPPVPVAFSFKDSGNDAANDLSPTLRSLGAYDANGGSQMAVAIQERAVSENPTAGPDGAGWRDDGAAYTLEARSVPQSVAFTASRDVAGALTSNYGKQPDSSDTNLGPTLATSASAVRRLTPRECERLQGFPDDYTLVPYGRVSKAKLDADFIKYQMRGNPKHLIRADLDRLSSDGPRYKALGNSMAVPVMAWIGRRIELVEQTMALREAA